MAVFDDVLTHYKSASDNGWPTTSYDDDLSNISEVLSGRMLYVGQAHQTDFQGAILSYAYKDLNSDGTLELVIAAVTASDYIPVMESIMARRSPSSKGKGGKPRPGLCSPAARCPLAVAASTVLE